MSSSKTPGSPPVARAQCFTDSAAFAHLRRARHSQPPHHPLQVEPRFRGFLVHFRYDLSSCSPPLADRPGFPGHGDFYARASDGLVTLPAAGYDYGGRWAAPPAGLSPAGTAASLAAPQVPGEPLRTCPALRPRRDRWPRPVRVVPYSWHSDIAFRCFDGVGSHHSLLSGLNHAACTLAVYASRPRSPVCCLTAAQDSLPAGGLPWPDGTRCCP
jgi:hypothetical protein